MTVYRERPKCRKLLVELMKERKWSLLQLRDQKEFVLSSGLKMQLKKMLVEERKYGAS